MFEAFGVVFERAADVDFFQCVIKCLVGGEQIVGQGFGVIEPGDGFAGMGFAGCDDLLDLSPWG